MNKKRYQYKDPAVRSHQGTDISHFAVAESLPNTVALKYVYKNGTEGGLFWLERTKFNQSYEKIQGCPCCGCGTHAKA